MNLCNKTETELQFTFSICERIGRLTIILNNGAKNTIYLRIFSLILIIISKENDKRS